MNIQAISILKVKVVMGSVFIMSYIYMLKNPKSIKN